MAGPLIQALRNFVQNRPERVERRRNFISDLLTPFDAIGRTDEMQGVSTFRRPVQRGGLFSSLGGNQTARQDMRGAPLIMPNRRTRPTPAYAASADTGMSRPDNSDANGNGIPDSQELQMTPQARTRITQPANPDRTYGTARPAPVQGGVADLPAPPTDRRSELIQARDQYRRSLSDMTRRFQDEPLTEEQLKQMPYAAVMANSALSDVSAELEAMDAKASTSLQGKTADLTALAGDSLKTGEWGTFDNSAKAMYAVVTKDGVQMADPNAGRSIAKPYIQKHAKEIFQKYNGLAQAPPDERASLLRSMTYAYPIAQDAVGNTKKSELEKRRISAELNALYNINQNTGVASYFDSLAEMVVIMQGGFKN